MAHFTARLAVVLATFLPVCQAELGAQARERVVFVAVVDAKTGVPVDEITPRDVVIREDRVTREVLRVSRATGPMPVAVLVDNSAAAESAIADIRNALTSFLTILGDIGPVAIVSMADRPTVVTDYTSTAPSLAAGVARIFSRPDSGVTTLEAVLETCRGIATREGERAAIVILSAGGVEHSMVYASRALEVLKDTGATLHAVVLSSPGRNAFDDAARQRDTLLDRGVRNSGGVRRDVLTSMAFGPALADLARAMTHQFRVVYARPQTLIPPESLEVAAAAPGHIAYGTAARGQPK